MLKESNKKEFDLTEISVGYAVRFQMKDDQLYRLGLVVKATATTLRIVYTHRETGAIAYVDILARDVDLGIWEILYTKDLENTLYMGSSNGELSGN